MSAVKGGRLRGALHRSLVVLIAVVAFALGALLWWLRGPGPMDFAGGRPVALTDYHAAEPTGVPVALRDADPVARGRVSGARRGLHGLPHRAGRSPVRGWLCL